MNHIRSFAITVLVVSLFFANQSFAAIFESGSSISVDTATTEDHYLAGDAITIQAPIQGDVLTAGNSIIIKEPIAEDVFIAGNSVVIDGTISGDLRVAASSVVLNNDVAGDVIIFAGNVVINTDVMIGGDLIVFAGTVSGQGIIQGDMRIGAETIDIDSEVSGPASIRAQNVTLRGVYNEDVAITVMDKSNLQNAVFNKNVEYFGITDDISTLQVAGELQENPNLQELDSMSKRDKDANRDRNPAIIFLGTLLLMAAFQIIVMMYLFGRNVQLHVQQYNLKRDFWVLFVNGAVLLFLPPMLALLLLFSVVGIPLGIFVLILYIFLLLFGSTISSVITAYWLSYRFQLSGAWWQIFLMSWGVLSLSIIVGSLPFIGFIMSILYGYVTFGVLTRIIRNKTLTE